MINKNKKFKIPANFFRIFYVFLPILIFLKFALGEKSFVELMVILIAICLCSDIIIRLCSSKKELGFASIFTPLSKKSALCKYFEHLFWMFLTCLLIISFAKIQIYVICLAVYALAKSFAYILSKPFKGEKFHDVTRAEAIAFFVIGFVVITFLADFYGLSFVALIFIYSCLALMTLMDTRKTLIKFNNSSLAILVFTISLTIFDGIWSIF